MDHDVENCPGCLPVVFDAASGEKDEKLTKIAVRAYRKAPLEEKQAWHRVTCLNSRAPLDVALAQRIVNRLEAQAQN